MLKKANSSFSERLKELEAASLLERQKNDKTEEKKEKIDGTPKPLKCYICDFRCFYNNSLNYHIKFQQKELIFPTHGAFLLLFGFNVSLISKGFIELDRERITLKY